MSLCWYFAGQTIKQADVILLAFPFMWNMTHEVRRKDLEIYGPVSFLVVIQVLPFQNMQQSFEI